MDIVLSWLDNIIRRGALERYFRPEYRYGSGISAIPIETSRLVDTERFIQSRKHSGKICINESGELIGNLKFTRNDDETK